MEEKTLSQMFLNRVKRYGDKMLYHHKNPRDGTWERVSYSDAYRIVKEIALGLDSLGVRPGERVAILSANRPEWVYVDWANIAMGVLTVPSYATNTPEQVEYIVNHSEAKVLCVENKAQLDKVVKIRNQIGIVKKVVLFEEKEGEDDWILTLEELRALGRERAEKGETLLEERAKAVKPEDDFTIIYTSGTTGPPKGVLTTHANYSFMITASAAAIQAGESDSNLQFLPFAHAFGRLEHLAGFERGVETWFAESLDTIAQNLLEVSPTIVYSVPRVYEKIYSRITAAIEEGSPLKKKIFNWSTGVGRRVSRHIQEGKSLPLGLRIKYAIADRLAFRKLQARVGGRLRFFVSGGAPLAREIAEFFHAAGILILEGYGMTETSTASHINRLDKYKFGTVGPPMQGVEQRIANDGEILVRGPIVFKGYYKNPEATRETIDSEGWLHTGDIGEIDEDGFLLITDRKKDLIVTAGGKNVAPQNIENLMKTDPFISQIMAHGDRRKFCSAVIAIDQEQVAKWAEKQGIANHDYASLADHPKVHELIQRSVDERNTHLAPFEQVKKFVLAKEDFTQEGGELTPSLKVKRKFVTEKYQAVLDKLYGEKYA